MKQEAVDAIMNICGSDDKRVAAETLIWGFLKQTSADVRPLYLGSMKAKLRLEIFVPIMQSKPS